MLSPLLYDDINGQLVNPDNGARTAGPGAGTVIDLSDRVLGAGLKTKLSEAGNQLRRFRETSTGTEYNYFVPLDRLQVADDDTARHASVAARGACFGWVSSLFASDTTTLSTVPYSQETVQPTGAGPVAVGGALAHATFTLVAATAPVARVGVDVPLSNADLAAIPNLRAKALLALPYMVNHALDNMLLNGNGTAPALKGILQTTGINAGGVCNQGVDTIADPLYACVKRGINLVESGTGFAVDTIIMNPSDWTALELLQQGDNATTLGPLLIAPPGATAPLWLFGKPVALSPALSAKTILVGCFQQCAKLYWKQAVAVDDSGANVASADTVVALAVEVPKGFAKCLLQ